MRRSAAVRAGHGACVALAALVLLAVLVGCADPRPRRVPLPPTFVPPERVDQMVAIALHEWARWGFVDVLVAPGAAICALQADGACLPVDDGCGQEQTAALCPVVDEYWRALAPGAHGGGRHGCAQTDRCLARWDPAFGLPQPTPPWSAAFISAVMRQAGFKATEFRFGAAHAEYLVAAREGYASAFELLPVSAAPRVGDLACATRGAASRAPRDPAGLRDTAPVTAMHCDLVVQVDEVAHRLQAVGGNVQQSVARSLITLDAQNRLDPRANAERPWVALMRPRLDPAAVPGLGL